MKTKKSILVITTIFVFLFASVASGETAQDKKTTETDKTIKKACTGVGITVGAFTGAAALVVTKNPSSSIGVGIAAGKVANDVCNSLMNQAKDQQQSSSDSGNSGNTDSSSNTGNSDSSGNNSNNSGNSDNSDNNQQQQNNNNGTS